MSASAGAPVPQVPLLRVLPRAEHPISRKDLSPNALKILYRLIDAGYEAYLVGGCVRDILLGETPKDFDVATNARPEEIRSLFRSARLIGRRFRLAHVRIGGEMIEVSTFRSRNAGAVDAGGESQETDGLVLAPSGIIVEDNVYGTIDEDAMRRDFTINALYYTPKDFAVHDYMGGLEDIERRVLRTIGDPAVRYREDPVRMLRAVRLAAKLRLEIETFSREPIASLGRLLHEVPAARLFDELTKMFLSGSASAVWDLLGDTGLLEHLLPDTYAALDYDSSHFVELAMGNTDARVEEDKPVNAGFLFAVLLWPPLRKRIARDPSPDNIAHQAQALVARQNLITSIPARFGTFAREVWELQPRLERVTPRRATALLGHPRFRAGYDFLAVRAQAGEVAAERVDFWTDLQEAEGITAEIGDAQDSATPDAPRPRRRRRRRAGPGE